MLYKSKVPPLALLVALAALAAIAGPARAAIEFTTRPGGAIELRSEGKLTFETGTFRTACRVTFRGRLLTTTIPTTSGSKFGELTSARIEECEREGTVERALISEREPWELKVSSLLGGPPEEISGLLYTISRVKLQASALGLRCLYEGVVGGLMTLTQAETFGFTVGATRLLERETLRRISELLCPETATVRGRMTFAPAQELEMRAPIAVSVGDSYISGEAGRWAGNTSAIFGETRIDALTGTAYLDAGAAEAQPGCHRSRSAEIRIGEGYWPINYACSGARTRSFSEGTQYKPGLDFENAAGRVGQAQRLENLARRRREIRLVAVSIGGNNFEFGKIVRECLLSYLIPLRQYCNLYGALRRLVEAAEVRENEERISAALVNVHEAMERAGYRDEQYTIVVQNYMSPIPTGVPGDAFRYWEWRGEEVGAEEEVEAEWESERAPPGEEEYEPEEVNYRFKERQRLGGCGFYNVDARWANEVVLRTINRAVAEAITRSRVRVTQMRLETAFNGRRLCETTVRTLDEGTPLLERWDQEEWVPGVDRTEWINQIRTIATLGANYYLQESLHPNFWGQLALRNCLRRTYNNGAPVERACRIERAGLTARREPIMQ